MWRSRCIAYTSFPNLGSKLILLTNDEKKTPFSGNGEFPFTVLYVFTQLQHDKKSQFFWYPQSRNSFHRSPKRPSSIYAQMIKDVQQRRKAMVSIFSSLQNVSNSLKNFSQQQEQLLHLCLLQESCSREISRRIQYSNSARSIKMMEQPTNRTSLVNSWVGTKPCSKGLLGDTSHQHNTFTYLCIF